MSGTAHRVTLMAGGDVGPLFERTESLAELISPVLAQADLRFAQWERTYSRRGRASALHKADEVYKGRVCFYSIGNFMNPGPVMKSRERLRWNRNWFQIEEECMPPSGLYFFSSHCRMTMVAKATISKQGVERVAFLPAFINQHGQPFVVAADDPKFRDIVDYTEWVSAISSPNSARRQRSYRRYRGMTVGSRSHFETEPVS